MSREALDAAYNNRLAVPEYPVLLARRREESERIRATRAFNADLRYGDSPRERLDFFPAREPGAALVAFIHGGYWQSNDKESSTYVVEGPLARGFSVALVEYTLAPEADIDRIVREIRAAVEWLALHAAELHVDPRRLYLAGHSAGGHLAAMMLGHPAVAGAMAISGLFELEPIRLCYLNDKLRLTGEAAQRNSPRLHLPASCPPTIVAVGANELPELVRQSSEYAAALTAAGLPARHLELAGHHHFSILDELATPDGALCCALDDMAHASVAT
ncbi:MAG: alpha/beta hydrolase [Burkholderiales bacterium]